MRDKQSLRFLLFNRFLILAFELSLFFVNLVKILIVSAYDIIHTFFVTPYDVGKLALSSNCL